VKIADGDQFPNRFNMYPKFIRIFMTKVDNEDGTKLLVSFKFKFMASIREYWFAYCYPFSYEENKVGFFGLWLVLLVYRHGFKNLKENIPLINIFISTKKPLPTQKTASKWKSLQLPQEKQCSKVTNPDSILFFFQIRKSSGRKSSTQTKSSMCLSRLECIPGKPLELMCSMGWWNSCWIWRIRGLRYCLTGLCLFWFQCSILMVFTEVIIVQIPKEIT
jgi:hypothetical protein